MLITKTPLICPKAGVSYEGSVKHALKGAEFLSLEGQLILQCSCLSLVTCVSFQFREGSVDAEVGARLHGVLFVVVSVERKVMDNRTISHVEGHLASMHFN